MANPEQYGEQGRHRARRVGICALGALLALAVGGGEARAKDSEKGNSHPKACSRTSRLMFRACRYEAQSDYLARVVMRLPAAEVRSPPSSRGTSIPG